MMPSLAAAFPKALDIYDQYLERIKTAYRGRSRRELESLIKKIRQAIEVDIQEEWSPEIKTFLEELDLHVHEITLRYNTKSEMPQDLVVDIRGEGNPTMTSSEGLNSSDVDTLENDSSKNYTSLPVDRDAWESEGEDENLSRTAVTLQRSIKNEKKQDLEPYNEDLLIPNQSLSYTELPVDTEPGAYGPEGGGIEEDPLGVVRPNGLWASARG